MIEAVGQIAISQVWSPIIMITLVISLHTVCVVNQSRRPLSSANREHNEPFPFQTWRKWRKIILIVANWGFFSFLFACVFVFNCILLSSLNCLSLTAHYTASTISDLKFGIYSEASWSTFELSRCLSFLSTVTWIRWVLYVSECARDTRKNRQHVSRIKRHPKRLIGLYNSGFISFPQIEWNPFDWWRLCSHLSRSLLCCQTIGSVCQPCVYFANI